MPSVTMIGDAHIRGSDYLTGETYEVIDDHAEILLAMGVVQVGDVEVIAPPSLLDQARARLVVEEARTEAVRAEIAVLEREAADAPPEPTRSAAMVNESESAEEAPTEGGGEAERDDIDRAALGQDAAPAEEVAEDPAAADEPAEAEEPAAEAEAEASEESPQ